jgi:hypothetical protein
MRNRIINGAMVIDQRNAGASVTVNSDSIFFPVDRFLTSGQNSDGVFTAQQSSVVPTGFSKSLLFTVTTADSSIGSGQRYEFVQNIEGFNTADLGFGTASASTVNLSFWVRSSLTGTFGGALRNSSGDRSYVFSYVINSANTWEQKTITIAGDTSGTWIGATNGIGLRLYWSLGTGSSASTTAGVWSAGGFVAPTGQTQFIGTNGATFYITGVQLEKGSTATSFDYRPFGTELALCQRYYEKSYSLGTVPNTVNTADSLIEIGTSSYSNSVVYNYIPFKVTKRAAPSVTPISYLGVSGKWEYGRSGATNSAADCEATSVGQNSFNIRIPVGAAWVVAYINGHYTASAEL